MEDLWRRAFTSPILWSFLIGMVAGGAIAERAIEPCSQSKAFAACKTRVQKLTEISNTLADVVNHPEMRPQALRMRFETGNRTFRVDCVNDALDETCRLISEGRNSPQK